jgi:hypothetical protein
MLPDGKHIETSVVGELGGSQNVLQALLAPPSACCGVRSPKV